MDSEELKNRIYSKLDKLNSIYGFDSILYGDAQDSEIEDYYTDFLDEIGTSIGAKWIKHGCSKIVISFPWLDDYVIKIPLRGSLVGDIFCNYDEGCYYYETFVEWIYNDYFEKVNFKYAYETDTDWDYCSKEVIMYEKAKENNVEKFFAETKFLFYFMEHPIYISKNIPFTYSYSGLKPTPRSWGRSSQILEEGDCGDLEVDMLGNLIDCYDEDDIFKFLNFIESSCIHDLHDENLRITADNKLVFVDYSSFDY